jgi:hypothetical protein
VREIKVPTQKPPHPTQKPYYGLHLPLEQLGGKKNTAKNKRSKQASLPNVFPNWLVV